MITDKQKSLSSRLGDLLYVIERFMNVYQPVFPLFIWSFQEKSVILQRN